MYTVQALFERILQNIQKMLYFTEEKVSLLGLHAGAQSKT
jgi:hypothetical protein